MAHVCEDDGSATTFVAASPHAVTFEPLPLPWPSDRRAVAARGDDGVPLHDGGTLTPDPLQTAA